MIFSIIIHLRTQMADDLDGKFAELRKKIRNFTQQLEADERVGCDFKSFLLFDREILNFSQCFFSNKFNLFLSCVSCLFELNF